MTLVRSLVTLQAQAAEDDSLITGTLTFTDSIDEDELSSHLYCEFRR